MNDNQKARAIELLRIIVCPPTSARAYTPEDDRVCFAAIREAQALFGIVPAKRPGRLPKAFYGIRKLT